MRHKIGVCIQSREIAWANGPFPCGSWNDVGIAQDSIICESDLEGGEMTPADGGHQDSHKFFETPTGKENEEQHMKGKARSHHETVNGRLKPW